MDRLLSFEGHRWLESCYGFQTLLIVDTPWAHRDTCIERSSSKHDGEEPVVLDHAHFPVTIADFAVPAPLLTVLPLLMLNSAIWVPIATLLRPQIATLIYFAGGTIQQVDSLLGSTSPKSVVRAAPSPR